MDLFGRVTVAVLVAGVLSAILGRPAGGVENGFQAGAAKVTITPQQPMWMSGYASRNRPAEGKLTDLWAKALVLQDAGGERAVLVTLDLVGIGRELSQSVCGKLQDRYGLDRRQIALCSSHTHTGPVVRRNLSPLHYLTLDEQQQQRVEQYAVALEENIVDVVGQALENLAPSRLSWGSGKATFAVNRRNNREAQVPELRAEGQLQGPHDHDVPVLAVHDQHEQLQAVVFGYACHATVLSFYQWSGDYPGFAQMELEQSHPGCVALFWAGCGADQNPLPRRTVELARDYGRQLAEAVQAVFERPMESVEGRLATRYDEIELPFDRLPTREEVEQDIESDNRYVAARARLLLEQLDAGRPLRPSYPYPVGLWQIGDQVQWVMLGGEVVVDYALRLKAELGGTRTWVAGYANDVMAYIPSRRVLLEGGYEGGGAMVYYGLPGAWAVEVEQAIIDQVHAQAGSEQTIEADN